MAAPYEDEAIAWDPGVGTTPPYNYWLSLASRRLGQSTASRGKQYELDTVQTGEYAPTYDNRDGALSPKNPSSPYYPNVTPFRPLRKRVQSPATQNMLTANQASAGEAVTVAGIDAPVAAGNPVPQVFSSVGNPAVTASATAFEGSQVFQSSVPGSVASGTALIWVTGASVVPGGTHSFSIYVRTPTGSAALSVQAALVWIRVGQVEISRVTGTPTSLPVASNTWTRLTVSGTAPANAGGVYVAVFSTNSPAGAYTFQSDGLQLEYAAAVSAYTKPGTWYPIFTGWVERWPLQWNYNGLWNQTKPNAVDSFGYLSQKDLKPPLYADLLALAPNFLYTFDQGQGAQYVTDLTHNNAPAPVTNSIYGAGSLTFGNSIQATTKPTVANPAGGAFLGGSTQVATFANVDSGGSQEHATYVDLLANGGPKAGAGGYYTRYIAFRVPTPPTTSFPQMWGWNSSAFSPPYGGENGFGFVQTTGVAEFLSGGFGVVASGTTNACNGDWHLWGVIANPALGTIQIVWDGAILGTITGFSAALTLPVVGGDAVGASIVSGSNAVGSAWAGDVAFICELPFAVTVAQAAQLYTSFRNAYSGESSAARYSRILGYAGYKGASNITTTPQTTAMGPASDITQGGTQATIYSPVTGVDAQTALQNVVTTENGTHFIAADGTITFQSRAARYGVVTPSIVFGENKTGGEIPYENVGFDFDTTHVANDTQITQFWNSTVYEAFNTASDTQIGTRTLTRTINAADAYQCNDAASYLAYRYGNADLRLKSLRVHVTANPTLWATLLGLEIGVRCRVMRRDLAATIQWDGFIEQLGWEFDYDHNEVYLNIQASPAALSVFWELAALRTTLASPYSAAALNSNTGFESGISPWAVTGGTVAQSSTHVHSGSFAAKLTPNGVAAQCFLESEQIAVTVGNAYTATGWVWFTNTVSGSNAGVSVNWYSSSHTYITTVSNLVPVTAATWTQLSNTFTVPAGAAYATIVVQLTGTPAAAQIFYVDDATLSAATLTLNPFPNASTIPVGAVVPGDFAGTSDTVQVGSYTTPTGTVPAFKLRVGAGTGTFEEVTVTSYTCTGGTRVTNLAGLTVPGQFINYTSVTFNLANALANSYASGTAVSEALPAGVSDPTAYDADAVLDSTTIIGY